MFTAYAKGKAPRLLREAERVASGSELFGCHAQPLETRRLCINSMASGTELKRRFEPRVAVEFQNQTQPRGRLTTMPQYAPDFVRTSKHSIPALSIWYMSVSPLLMTLCSK
jgi:hypothetical protein